MTCCFFFFRFFSLVSVPREKEKKKKVEKQIYFSSLSSFFSLFHCGERSISSFLFAAPPPAVRCGGAPSLKQRATHVSFVTQEHTLAWARIRRSKRERERREERNHERPRRGKRRRRRRRFFCLPSSSTTSTATSSSVVTGLAFSFTLPLPQIVIFCSDAVEKTAFLPPEHRRTPRKTHLFTPERETRETGKKRKQNFEKKKRIGLFTLL